MENGWIIGAEFRDALANAGSPATAEQVERWRHEGLLPRPRQIGHGRGRGSHTAVPFASVAQAEEIARLYAIRRKRDWVGWQLWLRGFDVAERYWREPLENARMAIFDTRQAARRYERGSQATTINSDTLKGRVLVAVRNTPLYAPLTKIRPDMVETLGGFLRDIVLGRFIGFSHEGNSQPNRRERDAVLTVMGTNTAGSRMNVDFAGIIESELQDIAKAFSVIARRNSIAEPSPEARREFLAAMEIGTSLYLISKAVFSTNALGVFNRIATIRVIPTQAAMLLAWSEYRQISNSIRPLSETGRMRDLAVAIALEIRELSIKI